MYNLLVSGDDESWNGEPFMIKIDRYLEGTDNDVREAYGKLSDVNIGEIIRFPCIFAYEKYCQKNPRFGLIKELTVRKKGIKIQYEIIPVENFLTANQLIEMQFELDISKLELNRTHWAIKNVDLPKQLYSKNILLPDLTSREKNPTIEKKNRNKVFVSYSHKDKEYLQDVKRHFKPFLKKLDFWDDSKIEPGQKWKEEIRKAISETKVAILLVSTDFLGSEFIVTDELPPLLEAAKDEGAVILIAILKPCLFEEFSDLNQFQAMNPPSRPISKMDMNEREQLYVDLVRETKRILKENETI